MTPNMDDNPRGGGANTSGPKLIRPIPRRPFNLGLSSPTPPEEDEECTSPRQQISASDLRFLAPHQHVQTPGSRSRDGSTPLSHTTSYLNLTSPTLFGIYSPSTLSSFTNNEDEQDQYFPGTDGPADRLAAAAAAAQGTDTPDDFPLSRPDGGDLDEETYSLLRRRHSAQQQHHPSQLPQTSSSNPRRRSKTELALQLTLRAALLFALGVGYGILVTRLPQGTRAPHSQRLAAYESHYEWRYLAFWGGAGVALGSLLPWFDRFWEDRVSSPPSRRDGSGGKVVGDREKERMEMAAAGAEETEAPVTQKPSGSAAPQADWALVVRGIGAFVGIVFAIRKLPWTSTMQVSLTLALANPFLWYLIDRSKPGFLLSAAVGLAGSAVLMGIDPDVMPAPTMVAGAGARLSGAFGNATGTGGGGGLGRAGGGPATSHETIETSIWMLSVLFCSCVCFGNIGRRLALNSSAAGRGRWGGVR